MDNRPNIICVSVEPPLVGGFRFRRTLRHEGNSNTNARVGAVAIKGDVMTRDELLKIGLQKKNGELGNITWDELNEEYGRPYKSGDTWRKTISRYAPIEKHGYKESVEIGSDGTQKSDMLIRMSKQQSKDTEFVLKQHGYDPRKWEVVNAKSSEWQHHNKQDGTLTLYASKVTVKPKEQQITQEDIDRLFKKLNRTYKPRTPNYKHSKDSKMLELNIADLHLGKLAWQGDAGDTYDMKIAERRFFYIIDDVLSKTNHISKEKILFIWSNDYFHFDNIQQTTTSGTHQDSDTRWAKMFDKGVEMLIKAIDQLVEIAPVETMYIGSNHDKQTAYYATKFIEAWFRNDKDVTVDARPISRKYYEYGNTLIEFTHGHNEGKRIGSTMEVEAREAWGRTEYHEVHAGHFHTDQVKTMPNGTVIRYSPSPSGTDVWHHDNGYVGSVKKGQSYLYDYKTGLDLIIPTTITR